MPESDARSVEQTLWLTSYTSTAVQNQNFWNICYSCRDNDIILGKGPLLKMGGARQTSRWCQSNHRTLFSVKSVKTDSHTHTEQPYAARLVE